MSTALVTCGGGFQGLGMVRALRDIEGMRVLVCDTHADSPARYACHDYLMCPPLTLPQDFKAFLLRAVKDRQVGYVFPATAFDLCMLADLQPALRELGATTAVSSRPLLDDLLDKQATRRFLADAGLPAETSIDPDLHDYGFPLLGKPIHGWGGRGAITLDSRDAWKTTMAIPRIEEYAWSRYFEAFDEYSADFAIGAGGAISTIVVRRRTRTSGGFAVISESVREPLLDSLFAHLANALARNGGLGCFNVQVIAPKDTQNSPFVSDINPRLGTSAVHALAEGINLPCFFVASNEGKKAAAPTRAPVKNVRLLQDLPLPQLQRRPRGLVFDFDDTLVDHKRWLFAKMERLYVACFRNQVEASAYRLVTAQLIDEHDWPRLIDRMLELLALPASLRDAAIRTYRDIEVDTPLFDDVEPVLPALAAAGIRLAILTDNPPATQRRKLLHAPTLRSIDAVVFTRETGGEKPAQTAFRAVAEKLDLPPGDLVMVGDNWFRDGIGALRAGYAQALVVRRDTMSRSHSEFCLQATPIELANRIHALPDLIAVRHVCLDAPA